ncbi:hypothetical protein LOC67_13700 [Stieleria sp. JC731]|uniref:hypothetical protein n=1 Tax=Pirellulaceae TaxID=2691357 RepID=UPI001E65A000|nr:hypothetical protein [Stieleria sp. JC731]MCC9601607.1 hypothetical protein [Stieleria sp. JC731]
MPNRLRGAHIVFAVWVLVGWTSLYGEEGGVKERSEVLFAHFDQTGKQLSLKTRAGETYRWDSKPLFRFSSEGKQFGSVYVWTDAENRLAAVGTIGSIPLGEVDYEFVELHLVKPSAIEPIELGNPPNKTWRPETDELTMKPVPSAPAVGGNENARLRQMRSIARQFSAKMQHDGRTNQLRLLPQPLYRYPDSTSEFDGALFAFVWDNGTDPEVLLQIELGRSEGKAVWTYQPIRFTWRAVEVSVADKTVWKKAEFFERNQALQTTPYLTGLTESIP